MKSFASMTSDWKESERMPALFVGHGNPMNALYENDTTRSWRNMAKGLKPKAILCISAHWQTRGSFVTMAPKPKTIHDFGGFPQELFDLQYPAPGSPEIASEVIKHVEKVSVEEDHEWGLDHGTWSVLLKMFPDADIPVFQLSLDYGNTPAYHYKLAEELRFLRKKGVLIVGSGNIIHNLGKAKWNSDVPYDWAVNFDELTKEYILQRKHEELASYSQLGLDARLSIPTNEHYIPMLMTLALQEQNESIHFFNETIEMGSISMRSFVIS